MSRDRCSKAEKEKFTGELDKLLDITSCPHVILLCANLMSGCEDPKHCSKRAHIQCDCPKEKKIPVLDLEWLAHQRNKVGEVSAMQMGGDDRKETKRQNKAVENKRKLADAEYKAQEKIRKNMEVQEEQNEAAKAFVEQDDNNDEETIDNDDVFRLTSDEK